jgi:hypothetical protein
MSTFALDTSVISYNGVPILGFGEDVGITITPTSDEWENRTMCDGHTSSHKLLDASAEVELTLRWNSPSNQMLETNRTLRTSGVLLIVLPNGTRYTGFNTRIQARPAPSVGKDHGDIVWKFFTEDLRHQFAAGEF